MRSRYDGHVPTDSTVERDAEIKEGLEHLANQNFDQDVNLGTQPFDKFTDIDIDLFGVEADYLINGEEAEHAAVIMRLWPSELSAAAWREPSTVISLVEHGIVGVAVHVSHETNVCRSFSSDATNAYCVVVTGFSMKPDLESVYWVVKKLQSICPR